MRRRNGYRFHELCGIPAGGGLSMKQIEESPQTAKRRFMVSLVLLLAGIIYTLFPIDIIPDILGPVGWVDDMGLLLAVFLNAANAYRRMKRRNREMEKP